MTDQQQKPVKTVFNEAIKAFNDLENSTTRHDSDEFKLQLKEVTQNWLDLKGIVHRLSLFSINESLEDLATSDIKYLGIEYYLAQLYSQNSEPSKINNLKKSILLYLQFLKNLNNYELLEKSNVDKYEKLKNDPFEIKTLHDSAMIRRDEKIANFKLEKILNNKLEYLNKLESNELEFQNTDEDEIRSLYFDQLKFFTLKTFDNIRFITQELEILQTIPERPKIEQLEDDDREETKKNTSGYTENLESLNQSILSEKGKILKPFTLMKRQDLNNKVYGTGQYLPTMTVEDFLEQELANGGMVTGGGNDGDEESSDEDDLEKNDLETYKARQWDEFTESHAKGSGNTINRG
ncbi:Immunoglobulin-binding protein 1 [Wickerhamomyces ciferrii]|uniref:Immunoglobulin-binding protein 1 n=1 Tax=Wickerhamomyces ciferrii (strain ATCC 14091 / BCRC 22168 / CBS 111 / JCM 3599 / NBRC 0793 / NRRL Y-1031 F-60-10) TaxID=1206466 RepID=K0KRY5_WICCF|nr:Immunoglobulin-binding protein 1 [Wickerhamomyces ciferrii]CCH44094.1 Immunoglobulin-binding protein 1 [Wickerhamomyces ciferrii]